MKFHKIKYKLLKDSFDQIRQIHSTNSINIISLDPFVSYFANIQKRKFIQTILPKNIEYAFKKDDLIQSKEDLKGVPVQLNHPGIVSLNDELKNITQLKLKENQSSLNSLWYCYFESPQSGLSKQLSSILKDIKASNILRLSQQTTEEPFNNFVISQLQNTKLTKVEEVKPGDLREALTTAVENLVRDNLRPVLIIDDGEFALINNETSTGKEGSLIRQEVRKFLDLLMDLGNKINVVIITHDIRLIKALKKISELREKLEFRSWNYASLTEVKNYLTGHKLNLNSDQIEEVAMTFLGHDGDLSQYISHLISNDSHEIALFKLIAKSYLQLRESIIFPPDHYEDIKLRRQFRFITFITFRTIYERLKDAIEDYKHSNSTCDDLSFPQSTNIVASITSIYQRIHKHDPSINMDDILKVIELLMTNRIAVLQEVNFKFDPFAESTDDVYLTWAGAKFQKGFERLCKDQVIIKLLEEIGVNFGSEGDVLLKEDKEQRDQ